MNTNHDEFRLNPPELDEIECPECNGQGVTGKSNCYLCEGDCYVPPILAAMYNAEMKSENE